MRFYWDDPEVNRLIDEYITQEEEPSPAQTSALWDAIVAYYPYDEAERVFTLALDQRHPPTQEQEN